MVLVVNAIPVSTAWGVSPMLYEEDAWRPYARHANKTTATAPSVKLSMGPGTNVMRTLGFYTGNC